MTGEERRDQILEILNHTSTPVTASRLADRFGVSRQIIVADIALLRATGQRITAHRRGYTIERASDSRILKSIICRHTSAETRDELYTIADHGCTAIDVIVEHPIYGEITAELGLCSRLDVDEFIEKGERFGANQLSILTDGLHIHTIAVPSEGVFLRLLDALRALGILVEST